ncbi:hypothetical protein C0991_006919, partial [Blastosporella zonata]
MSSDYVIVGAGVTGIALAVRLSEDPSINVTVLEAGSAPFHDEHIDTPAYALHQLGNPAKDWAFFSAPQKHLGDRPVFLPSASDIEYNDIAKKLGAEGFSWDDLLPYFKKSEGLKYDEEYAAKYGYKFNPEYHGTTGPLQTRIPTFLNAATLPWLETLKGLGIKPNPDPCAGDITGSWVSLTTIDDKSIRSSAASAYYEPNQGRPNLKVISGALATKVLTSGSEGVVATGVEYLQDGILHTIHATKEDHFMIPLTVKVKNGLDLGTFVRMEDPVFAQKQTEQFKTSGTGLLAGSPVSYAFLTLKDFDKDGKIAAAADKLVLPDTPTYRLQKEWVKNDRIPFLEMNIFDRLMPGILTPEPGAEYLTGAMINLHPFNVGSVHISSNDPNAPPVIDHNYLDNEFDLQVLIEGFKLTRKLFSSAPLKDLVEEEVSPGPNFQADEQIAGFIKQALGSTWHPVGTASLLPRKDGGVVDTQFKVYGTKNLRVVDASVIPIQLGAHPQATLYAFAEKVSFQASLQLVRISYSSVRSLRISSKQALN